MRGWRETSEFQKIQSTEAHAEVQIRDTPPENSKCDYPTFIFVRRLSFGLTLYNGNTTTSNDN